MTIFYCLTVIAMLAVFVLFKKSEEKINLVNWCVIALVSYLAFNILVCMIFGCMNIKTDFLFLSIANLVVTAGLGFKIFKDKGIQKFEIRKQDILGVIVCVCVVCHMAVSQYAPLAKSVANASVDACMHYSASVNFADEMIVLSKIDNQTGYNFKTMQTGAYINTGIFINIIRDIIPAFEDHVAFKLFETGIMTLMVLTFYILISDRITSKKSFVFSMIFLMLYAYAYPYTSLLHGFCYLSLAIVFITTLFYFAKHYAEKEVSFWVLLPLIVLMGVGIIFSYCLFVPAIFAFICLYVFVKDFDKKEEKSYLKIFKKSTLLVTGLLLVVTIVSIFYLVIPTFTDSDQNKLTDAIGFEGGIYKSPYQDFLFYIPFVVLFIYRTIKEKKLNFQTMALLLIGGQTLLMFTGVVFGIVSPYYYYKMNFILWILMVEIAVEIFTGKEEPKELSLIFTTALVIWVTIIILAVGKFEHKLWLKRPTFFDQPESHSLAGIYYDTNVFGITNINASCIVDPNRVKLAEALRDVEGVTLKNMLVGGMNSNCKSWTYVIARGVSGGESINELHTAVVETSVEDFLEDNEKEFFVLYTGDKFETTEDYELVFQNEAGVILKKIHSAE